MRLLLIVCFLFNSIIIYSQHLGWLHIGLPQNSVEKTVDRQITKGHNNKRIIYSSKNTVGDTLIWNIKMNNECFTIKMIFKYDNPINHLKCCDYQEISFECPNCANEHLEETISVYNFRHKAENLYLSSFFHKTEMTVQYDLLGINVQRIIFRHFNLPKKEYKEYYKTLKKKNTACPA